MRATLGEAFAHGGAVAGFVCQGWEDARACVRAAESECRPVILQAGPGARRHMPIDVWGAMLGRLADDAGVPVVVHLDHGGDEAQCRAAIDHGFTCVMFDGSRLSLEENVERTSAIAAMAHRAGVDCEGEIGFVGYSDGDASRATDPHEAACFARDTGVDALAVSVGNVHLQSAGTGSIDRAALEAIRGATQVPLVIHGGSGVPNDVRRDLARAGLVAKFNIGTQMRQTFGRSLRAVLAREPDTFDRIAILHAVGVELEDEARRVIRDLAPVTP